MCCGQPRDPLGSIEANISHQGTSERTHLRRQKTLSRFAWLNPVARERGLPQDTIPAPMLLQEPVLTGDGGVNLLIAVARERGLLRDTPGACGFFEADARGGSSHRCS